MSSLNKPLPVLIYEPESELRHPLRLFKQMWFDLLRSRELALQLFVRDTQAEYRQSFLGLLWAFIPPLVTAIAATFIRDALNIKNIADTTIPYPLYVMFSMSLWGIFSSCLFAGINGVRTGRNMMKKIRVPPEAFVLNYIGQALFKFSIQLTLFALIIIAYNVMHIMGLRDQGVTLSWSAILAPVALIHLISLALGTGLMLAPFAVLYKDIGKLLRFGMKWLFFVTPVLYDAPKEGVGTLILQLNPVSSLLATTRDLVILGTVSEPVRFWITSAIAISLVLIGWVFNRTALPMLVERGQ
ncbi:MAG: ABC transporter permease [Microcystaceae cyanobacterium]